MESVRAPHLYPRASQPGDFYFEVTFPTFPDILQPIQMAQAINDTYDFIVVGGKQHVSHTHHYLLIRHRWNGRKCRRRQTGREPQRQDPVD